MTAADAGSPPASAARERQRDRHLGWQSLSSLVKRTQNRVECALRTCLVSVTACEGEVTMKKACAMAPIALLLLGACTPTVTATGQPAPLAEVPEAVRAAAAPFQDLSDVQLRSDGCYWYRHTGPVETTYLPLRTVEGRPICTRAPEEAATATAT